MQILRYMTHNILFPSPFLPHLTKDVERKYHLIIDVIKRSVMQ